MTKRPAARPPRRPLSVTNPASSARFSPKPSCAGGDDGSVLMLVPAAVLVLVILGAIAVDSAVVFLAQRDLANRTAAVANDVAAAALDDEAFYATGATSVDARQARRRTDAAFAERVRPPMFDSWHAVVTTNGTTGRVVVEAEAEVRYVFAQALPGAPRTARVNARSEASATTG